MEPPSKRRRTERRVFQPKWELEFFFTQVHMNIYCVICKKQLKNAKSCNLKHHFNQHQEKLAFVRDLKDNERKKTFDQLRAVLIAQLNETTESSSSSRSPQPDDPTWKKDNLASYEIAQTLAKHSKPLSDGPIVKECILIACQKLNPELLLTFSEISLSRNTITKRTDEIGKHLRENLKQKCATFVKFSIALDESTDVVDTAQLAIFIRGVDKDLKVTEEFLDIIPLHETTKGEDVFGAVENVFEDFELKWDRLESVATDGAPSMTGEKKDGFKARLNAKLRALGLPIVPLIHCIIHRENLCAKVIKMDHVINLVIKVVNFLRKQGLNHRSFRKLLKTLDCEFDDIPYHTTERWLSKEKVFTRFLKLKGPTKTFTKTRNVFPELEDEQWWQDLAFLKDLFTHLTSLNLQLQGANHTYCQFARSSC